MREGCTACQAVGARLTSTAQVKHGREFLSTTQVRGITPEVPEILVENLEAGRYVTDYDVRHSGRVSVVGADVVDNLFPFVDPVGKTLRINNRQFEIVGVGERQGSLMGQSPDNWVVIPITSFQRMWGARRSVRIYAKADSEESIRPATDQARTILRVRRHVAYGDDDDFAISTNETFLEL